MVLIADDDETTRIVLQRALTLAGYIALPVDDGGEIWPILDREDVAALVLDLKMPGVNGWEVLRRLRDDFRYRSRHVRVIVLSGQADPESRCERHDTNTDAACRDPRARRIERAAGQKRAAVCRAAAHLGSQQERRN